jgi:hypothetical protein
MPKRFTAEMDAELRRLVALRWSYSKIAFVMQRSRNSVIGRAHRLEGRGAGGATPMDLRKPRAIAIRKAPICFPIKPVLPHTPEEDAHPRAPELACDLLHLSNITCRWPHGDAAPYTFCGAPSNNAYGRPYCDYHTLLAYRPQARRTAPYPHRQ